MTTAVGIEKVDGKPGEVYAGLTHFKLDLPKPGPDDLVVHMTAAALNHRDLWIRHKQYPGASDGVPLLADGCGVVVDAGSSSAAQAWLKKRVVLAPGHGWDSDSDGPEKGEYSILGGTSLNPLGTLAEQVVVSYKEVEEAPSHLTDVEAAAVPLVGLTAWRTFFTKSANAKPGRNILITGIGGGVALQALAFAVGEGCNAYVSSSSEDKIAKAKELGAKGGVNYKNEKWEKDLLALLPKDRPKLDAIIDGAGGDIVSKAVKLLRPGGAIVIYGMTLGPQVPVPMTAVLSNLEVRLSTMGSRREFTDMIKFYREKKLKPVISRVIQGIDDLNQLDGLFEDMKKGDQFGKLVVQITKEEQSKL